MTTPGATTEDAMERLYYVADYSYPGVYVDEISTGPRSIEGVGTSTAGFVGETERGPTLPRGINPRWAAIGRIRAQHGADLAPGHSVDHQLSADRVAQRRPDGQQG